MARIMSEFSSGAFKPFGTPHQFLLHEQKFGGVRDLKVEEDSCQDVKWRVQDNNSHMESEVNVTSEHVHAGSFLARPDSTPPLRMTSSATFDHFSEHAYAVDEIFPRDTTSYEPSTYSLHYTSSSPAQLDELYGGYHAGGRWQATCTVTPDPNNNTCNTDSSEMMLVVPMSPQEITTKPLAYHLASATTSPFSSNVADSFNLPKFSLPSGLHLSSSSSGPGIATNMSIPVAPPPGQNYKATAAYRNSPKPPTSEHKRIQGKLGRGESRDVVPSMTLGLSSQSLAVNYHQARKVARTTSDFSIAKRQLYGSRFTTDHVEHVQRERQRRDDMSAKIATLETLLPPASKRDRVSIVHDGIHYVKSLQQKVKALQEQLQEAKRKVAGAGMQDKKRWSRSLVGSSSSNLYSSLNVTRTSAGFDTFSASSQGGRTDCEGSGLSSSAPLVLTPKREPIQNRGPVSVELHVQVDRPGEQVQVVKCECRHSYLSSVMRTLDQLQLSLHRCSVTKLHDYVICVIVIKPTSNFSTTHAVSSAQVATLLQIAAVDS